MGFFSSIILRILNEGKKIKLFEWIRKTVKNKKKEERIQTMSLYKDHLTKPSWNTQIFITKNTLLSEGNESEWKPKSKKDFF